MLQKKPGETFLHHLVPRLSLGALLMGISGGTILHCTVANTAEHLVSTVPATQIQQHPLTPSL